MKCVVALYRCFPSHNQHRTAVAVEILQHTAQNTKLASQQYDIKLGCTCPLNVIEYRRIIILRAVCCDSVTVTTQYL
jgi:hypothetical protein